MIADVTSISATCPGAREVPASRRAQKRLVSAAHRATAAATHPRRPAAAAPADATSAARLAYDASGGQR
jgi:hypothetical protein